MVNDAISATAPVRLLFVCTANVARSPLAAAMLQARLDLPAVSVTSAGTYAREGDRAAEGSCSLAVARGLDLSDHRSRPVTPELVRDTDLLLTATEGHRDRCGNLVPQAGSRTFTVREFVRLLDEVALDDGPVAVADRLEWLKEQAHYARPRSIRPQQAEDITDPTTGAERVWRELGETLDDLVGRLASAVLYER